MLTVHALPVPIVDERLELRAELARLERAWARVATALTIANFQAYVAHTVPAGALALIDAPVAPPLQPAHYVGRFEDQGAHEARLRPGWQTGRRPRCTAAQLAAAYWATPPPRSGRQVATTLQLSTKALFHQLARYGLSLRTLQAGAPPGDAHV